MRTDQVLLTRMEHARAHVEQAREARARRPGWVIGVQRVILVVTGLIVTLLMAVQVVTRYVFDFSIFGIEELMSFFAVWLYFMGSAHGAWSRSQISASLLDVVLPFGRLQQGVRVLACAISALLSGWMGVWASQFFLNSIHRHKMSLEVGIPLAWVYVVMPLGLFLMAIYFALEGLEEIAIYRGRA